MKRRVEGLGQRMTRLWIFDGRHNLPVLNLEVRQDGVQLSRAEPPAGREVARFVHRSPVPRGNAIGEVPILACRHGDATGVRIPLAERKAEIGVCSEGERQGAVGKVIDLEVDAQGGALHGVGDAEPEIRGPLVEQGWLVDGRLKLTNGAIRCLLQDAPWTVQDKPVDRVPVVHLSRVDAIGSPSEGERLPAQTTPERKEDGDAAARRPAPRLPKIRRGPEHLDRIVSDDRLEVVAVEPEGRQD